MLISPKKFKYKKVQKGPIPNKILSAIRVPCFGSFGLKAIDFGVLSGKEIDSARKIILKKIKKKGKLWTRIFPHIPVTRKPVESRMGKGKGSVDQYVFKIRPGTILYEIEGLPLIVAKDLFKLVSKKLSIATKITFL